MKAFTQDAKLERFWGFLGEAAAPESIIEHALHCREIRQICVQRHYSYCQSSFVLFFFLLCVCGIPLSAH